MAAASDQPSTSVNSFGPTLAPSSETDVSVSPNTEAYRSDAAAAAPLSQTGRYQLEEEIGRGGMGVVYRALDLPMQRRLAIKLMLAPAQGSEQERRFLEEARITGQLQHPGIAPVHQIGRLDDGRAFFAMKLIEGRTLAALLKARASTAEELPRFLAIFGQLCQTLAFVHARDMIHRDLKPANVMVGAFGEVQVMDWGLAKSLASRGRESPAGQPGTLVPGSPEGATQAGAILGTPAFMAPEQARGEIDWVDQRCDVFGLGAILSVILTGEPPHRGKDGSEIVLQAAAGDMRECFARLDASGADAELIALAKQCLAPSLSERLRDAGPVAEAVERYQSSIQERLRKAELQRARAEVKSAEERKRRKLTLGLAAAVLVLLLLAGLGAWWIDGQRRERQRQAEQAHASVEATLTQVESLRNQARWEEARAMLALAIQQLDEGAPAELRERVRDAGDLLELVAGLDRVRQDKALFVNGKLNSAAAPAGYRDAFRAYRFDILQGDEDDLVKRLSASPVKELLVTALDDWAGVEKDRPDIQRRLDRLARRVDPDEWRDQLRAPDIWKDVEQLKRFAARADTAKLTAALAERLGKELEAKGGDGVGLLEKMWRQQPRDFWFSFALGNLLKSRRRLDEAIGYYRAALAVRPESSAAWNNCGNTLHMARDLESAAAAYRKALVLEPRHDMALANLSAILIEQGQLDDALDKARKAVALQPKNATALTNVGVVLFRRKEYPEAEKSFRQAIDAEPRFARPYTFLGVVRGARGDLDDEIRRHRQAVALDRQLALAHTNLGLALHLKGQEQEALDCFKTALELDPRDVQAYIGQGNCLLRLSDLDGAVDAFRRGTVADSRNASAHYNLSITLAQRRDFAGSLAACRKAIELEQNDARVWNQLGYLLGQTGKERDALPALRKAIALDDRFTLAHLNLAGSLYNLKQFEEAVPICRKAIALEHHLGQAHFLLGKILTAQGKFADALEAMREAKKVPMSEALRFDVTRVEVFADRMHSADKNLPAILRGQVIARGAGANMNLAQLCLNYRQLPVAASRFYKAAFAAEPAMLNDSLRQGYRFQAARAALQGAAGIGDGEPVDDAERIRLRGQALGWLHDDLTAWSKLATDRPAERSAIRRMLERWQAEADLALVRESKSRDKLPAAEQADWQKLWADVEELLQRSNQP